MSSTSLKSKANLGYDSSFNMILFINLTSSYNFLITYLLLIKYSVGLTERGNSLSKELLFY